MQSIKVTSPAVMIDSRIDLVEPIVRLIETQLVTKERNLKEYFFFIEALMSPEVHMAVTNLYFEAGWAEVSIDESPKSNGQLVTWIKLKPPTK